MPAALTIALVALPAVYAAVVVLLGRRAGIGAKTAYETGAIALVVAFVVGLLSLVDALNQVTSAVVCGSGERLESVWSERLVNGRRRRTSELACVGATGHRPASYFGPFLLFFDAALVVSTAVGAAAVAVSRRRAAR